MESKNSSLVSFTQLSPNHSGQRTHAIDRITPHCVVGQSTAEGLGAWFSKPSTKASSNYGIDRDGRVGLYVEEKNRSWCSSNNANDQRAVTIECASDTVHPYTMKDVVYNRLIELCTDICKRCGKTKLLWFADKNKTLSYNPKPDEMVITVHRWFANKSCPGEWLYSRLGEVASKVTKNLGGTEVASDTTPDVLYRVRKSWEDAKSQKGAYKILDNAKKAADSNPGYSVFDPNGVKVYPTATDVPFVVRVRISDLSIRKGAGTNYPKTGRYTGAGTFTIVQVQPGEGSSAGWGKLKSGAGWVSLDYCERV